LTPNLIVAGSPKCGTSSLHAWLAQVPGIAEGRHKEIRYLLDRGNPLLRAVNYHTDGLPGWLSYYDPSDIETAAFLLDSTPEYQRQQTALKVVGALQEKPRVILLFRKPSERIFSLYQFAKYHQGALAPAETFASFVDEVEQRGERFSAHPMLRNAFLETAYADIVDDWIGAVGRDNVRVMLLEAIERDPRREVAALLSWLELDPGACDALAFTPANRTAKVRWPRVRHFVGKTVQQLPVLKRAPGLRTAYRRVMMRGVNQDEYLNNASTRAALDRRFAGMIPRLSRHVDLSIWEANSV
jgi:hypothetical protein